MQDVLDEPIVNAGLLLEIRSQVPPAPTSSIELRHLGLSLLTSSRLLSIDGPPGPLMPEQLAALADPAVEEIVDGGTEEPSSAVVDVFCRPGVTDAEGEMAALALGRAGVPGIHCRAGTRYRFASPVPVELREAAERLLGNPLIHRFLWWEDRARGAGPELHDPVLSCEPARAIRLDGCGDEALLAVSREHGLALDLAEMRAVQAHFDRAGRAPTDVELQSVALAWSEHCSHKTFKATIHFDRDGRPEIIHGLLAGCIAGPSHALQKPWVRSAFIDNAGVMAFDEELDLAFKVETHNHPSALDPYGGAHTGVGGVVRDVLAVSAEPIANTDVLCFGPPDLPEDQVPPGAMHPRSVFRGVVRGVAGYGNNMGIPTVAGAVLFHSGYTANPLVYCGTLGIVPRSSHPTDPRPGDAVVLLGGRTGRDGLHGATMSSATLDRENVAASTVQIGAPITEKVLRDVLLRLRDERLYHAITDCGAGGLCSAVGEMGAELGVEVDLDLVPLKYAGLSPWEIWLSEAQERMVLAVPPGNLPRLFELCHAHEVEATVLGCFRDDGVLRLSHGGRLVADLELAFMHAGRPARVLEARWTDAPAPPLPAVSRKDETEGALTRSLQRLLAHPTIASKEEVIRRYDHEVQAGTVVRPLVGRDGPSDAAVVRPLHRSPRGVVLAHGINPLYGALDPHAMALLAVDEALRNLVAAGGSIDRAAMLDNFCWGEVDDPDALGGLVRAAQGCRDAVLRYGVPFISGKDSLRNTSVDASGVRSIPGTLLISVAGVVDDVRRCVTMDLETAGSRLYLLGVTAEELGGSHLHLVRGVEGGQVPRVREETPAVMRRLSRAIEEGLVLSCHDLSEGGLGVAAAEMALAGGLGMELDLASAPAETSSAEALLFSESPGRFLVEVSGESAEAFEALFGTLPCAPIGRVRGDGRFVVRHAGSAAIDTTIGELDRAWRTPLIPGEREPSSPPTAHGALADTAVGLPGTLSVSSGPSVSLPRPLVRALVLAAPGINCDAETAHACEVAGAEVERVHLNRLLSGERSLDDFGMLVLPGGFSYGDHLGAGAMLATTLRHGLLADLRRFAEDGRPVLGICNGFQVLARLGLLGPVSLVVNDTGRFECRWVRLQVEPSPCLFLDGLEEVELPIAHGEGRVVVPDGRLGDLLPLAPLRYRDNPNGSAAGIAGVCSAGGNVLGLMPHPERYLTPYHHPRRSPAPPAGLQIFRNAVRYVRGMP